ncbi:MAG: hypothetical protein COB41_01875 [Proteobacteria bacterium]|nr:MAG: hypothetical protein COB41_01875 [Pseudomonadota bacterium]
MNRLVLMLDFYHAELKSHPAADKLGITIEQRDVFNLVATLIDLPADGRLFYESREIVKLLVNAYEDETGKTIGWDKIDSIYIDKFEKLEMAQVLKKLRGSRGTNPLFAFLLVSAVEQDDLSRIANDSRYVALVPFLLKRIRYLNNTTLGEKGKYIGQLSLCARKIVVGAPSLQKRSSFNWSNQTKMIIARHAESYLVGSTKLISKPEYTYLTDLLFCERKTLDNRSGGGFGERMHRWLLFENEPAWSGEIDLEIEQGEESDGFLPSGAGKQVSHMFSNASYESLKKKVRDAGEYSVDYHEKRSLEFPASWFVDPWTAKRRDKGKVESSVAAQRIAPWDKVTISKKAIYKLIKIILDNPEPWKGVIALTLFVGVGEKSIKKMRLGNLKPQNALSREMARRLLQDGRFYDPKSKKLRWHNLMGTSDDGRYQSPSLDVEMRLPNICARHLVNQHFDENKLFSESDILKAKHYLKSMGKDGVSLITLKRLRNTFESFFIHGSGLPVIFADLIQNQERFYLRSQHYYITLNWIHTLEEWHRMVDEFVTGVLEELPVSDILSSMRFQVLSQRELLQNESVYAGANKTPSKQALRNHFCCLKDIFSECSGTIIDADANQWNAYVAYLYGFYAVATGNRPLRDPMPEMSCMNLKEGWIYIDDKHNRVFKESRIVPLCPILKKSLLMHQEIHQEWLITKIINGYELDGPRDSFFLIDEERKMLIPVSPRECDRLLCDQGKINDQYFEGLNNGFRHYLLTTLNSVGTPQLMIDFISGHRHMGMEPEFNASPVSWKQTANHLSRIIEEKVLRPLEIEVPLK